MVRIEPRREDVDVTVWVGAGPRAISASGDAVWVANTLDATVSRVDPTLGRVLTTTPVGGAPVALAADSDGVWVAVRGDQALLRLTVSAPACSAGWPSADRRWRWHAPVAAWPSPSARQRASTAAGRCACGHSGPWPRSTPAPAALVPPEILAVLYDGLTGFDRLSSSTPSLVADLAVALPTPTAGGRVYTFTLRPGLRYSNGAPVRASDFRRAVERVVRSRNEGTRAFDHLAHGVATALRRLGSVRPARQRRRRRCRPAPCRFISTEPDPDFLYPSISGPALRKAAPGLHIPVRAWALRIDVGARTLRLIAPEGGDITLRLASVAGAQLRIAPDTACESRAGRTTGSRLAWARNRHLPAPAGTSRSLPQRHGDPHHHGLARRMADHVAEHGRPNGVEMSAPRRPSGRRDEHRNGGQPTRCCGRYPLDRRENDEPRAASSRVAPRRPRTPDLLLLALARLRLRRREQRLGSRSGVSTDQRVDPKLARALQNALDRERAAASLTGVAAAVVIPGQGLWSGGSGVANRATKAPVTGRTPFPIASVTKTFVAALAIKLADEGRLRLDDPLGRWLPDWPNADKISLRQLLNHTSGVANFEQRIDGPYQRAIDAHPANVVVASADAELRAQAGVRPGFALGVQQRQLHPRRARDRAGHGIQRRTLAAPRAARPTQAR